MFYTKTNFFAVTNCSFFTDSKYMSQNFRNKESIRMPAAQHLNNKIHLENPKQSKDHVEPNRSHKSRCSMLILCNSSGTGSGTQGESARARRKVFHCMNNFVLLQTVKEAAVE
ncbi:hypothetical protein CDAR_74391 [Caerostris darwini]|uniref:Uncharacterized protein n=1 Tax=Caerostris darwini TaxID=1538125 RepID=A0AAV4UK49_9ARAC|nr:hypothetical protein CDAR_74391 [Caerostris darwini]